MHATQLVGADGVDAQVVAELHQRRAVGLPALNGSRASGQRAAHDHALLADLAGRQRLDVVRLDALDDLAVGQLQHGRGAERHVEHVGALAVVHAVAVLADDAHQEVWPQPLLAAS